LADSDHSFVRHLLSLKEKEDRGALAALRRGLGKEPGEAPAMFPHVVPWLPERLSRSVERCYYLVASLFALHPESATEARRNMGDVMREVERARGGRPEEGASSTEKRFVALLDAHPEDLPSKLRHAVALARSSDVAIAWNALFWDVMKLLGADPEKRDQVRKTWARSFWSRASQGKGDTGETGRREGSDED
jgi:CRISPR system Cascade subunit CasB